jgi:SAM-dependent methyltransferase
MKMLAFEKQFVNGKRHSSRIANRAEERLRLIEPLPGQRLLDVGCGNGAAAIPLARTFGLDATGIDIDPDQIHAAAEAANGLTDIRSLSEKPPPSPSLTTHWTATKRPKNTALPPCLAKNRSPLGRYCSA